MAGRGPAPSIKPMARERNERRKQAEFTTLVADGVLRGPELPDGDWHPRTVAWYATWRRSPMAAAFIDADWDFLLDTAMLHSQMWGGEAKHAAEIRLRVSKFGCTPEDRLRLRLEVDVETAKVVKPARMTQDRRDRLLQIVEA